MLTRIVATFRPDAIEYAVTYSHRDHVEANPGTKTRTTTATRMARKGLEAALEGLGSGLVVWGGFGTNTRVSKDTLIVDRKEYAA
jgi:hypothetical protein